MSYAAQLRDALTLAASIVQGDPRLGRIARDAAADVMLEADILPTMQAAVSLIIALEDEAQAAEAAAKRARLALRDALEATTGSVRAGIHTAHVRAGSASVIVTDETQIPAEYMRQPPPAPDKAAIAKALKAGEDIPGAVLRNGEPGLTIRVADRDIQKEHAA
jgi:hypothetical protein